mgnify:CR=1 FL=1
MNDFNAKKITSKIIDWIRWYFDKNGDENTTAVVGVSGGKDSSVVLKLCVEALGPERVIAVLLPRGEQSDIRYSYTAYTVCGIPNENIYEINIGKICEAFDFRLSGYNRLPRTGTFLPQRNVDCMKTNYPARIRMTVLYGIAALRGGRVANTCNLSEDWVGYATKFGDGAGDFSPLHDFTVQEVKAIGRELGLPSCLIDKVPTDGLCGKTDEENLGFTYETLDKYIRTGECDEDTKKIIDGKHYANLHKLKPMPKFRYRPDLDGKVEKNNEVTSD